MRLPLTLPDRAVSCRFLPLLPPITRNVKLPTRATRLEFGIWADGTRDTPSKSGKNGNVDHASQHCRTGHVPAGKGHATQAIRQRPGAPQPLGFAVDALDAERAAGCCVELEQHGVESR